MRSELKVIAYAQSLIDTPEKWCQNAQARAIDGTPVSYVSSHAVQFCAVSSLWRASHDLGFKGKFYSVLDRFGCVGYSSLASWNDDPSRTHAEVMHVFNQAKRRR